MGTYSKSFFNSNSTTSRSMINPVRPSSYSYENTNYSFDLPTNTVEILNTVEKNYTSNLASKNYMNIPNDYETLLKLYNSLLIANSNYTNNPGLNVLFQIAEEALLGSMNAYGLNFTNIETLIQNAMLQRTIDDMISGKNKKNAYNNSTGNLSVKKSFVLAPLFSYYISLYGMPEKGVGFDQKKLAMLLAILEKNGINPY